MPALVLAGWHLLYGAVLLPGLLFMIWNPQLFRGEGRIPKRTWVLFAAVTILSLLYLSSSWNWGVKYQGLALTALLCSINVAWAGFLSIAFARTWGSATSFWKSLLLHWLLFAWLGWYAFPWLGEMI